MKKFYDKMINSNEIVLEAINYLKEKNKEDSLYQKRFGVKEKLTELGFNVEVHYNVVSFKLEDKKHILAFSQYFSQYSEETDALKIELKNKEDNKKILFRWTRFSNYLIEIKDDRLQYVYEINSSEMKFSYYHEDLFGSVAKSMIKRDLFDFVMDNINIGKEGVLALCNINFDVDLRNKESMKVLIPEMLNFQQIIKQFNNEKQKIGLKL